MIYLDYSATTKCDKDILDTYNKVTEEYFANSSSLYSLGYQVKELIDTATNNIADLFSVKQNEIIYTSSATEANNMAIKGIIFYKNRDKKIITSSKIHSSIKETLKYMGTLGYDIYVLKNDSTGRIDLEDLKNNIELSCLVTIPLVSSEVGILEDIEKIKEIVKSNSRCFLHIDATQAVGKISFNMNDIDMISLSAHKLFGIKNSGLLIKKEKVNLIPLIHGGMSNTIYRSGTADQASIACMAKTLRKSLENIDEKYEYVKNLKEDLINFFSNYENILLNSLEHTSPYILNLSFLGIKIESFIHKMEEEGIYLSTKSACSNDKSLSDEVYSLFNDEDRAKTSFRISLSYRTTKEEIKKFKEVFNKVYKLFINIK
jgi:hypothetical protein